MAEAVVIGLFNKLNSYLIDLGIVSQVVSDKVLGKVKTTARDSILSSLQEYTKQGSSELDETLERLKKQPIIDRLNYLYGDNTFSGRYGIDIIKVCIVIFIFMSAVTYFQIQNKLMDVKRDWPEYRCRPDVMPFAGWINAPEGVSPMDYTKQNFMECSANTTKGVFDRPMSMVYVIFNVIMGIFKNILQVIERFRLLFNRMRDTLKNIFLAVFNRIQNVIIPLQNMLIKMVDFFEKIKGILATFLLTFVGALWSFYSLIGSIYELVVIILIIMIIVIIVLWYIPFVGWALAIAAIAVFLTIAIPLILLGIVSRQITRRRTSRMPSPDD
jgi:ABC-type multidrug transport system fused ATPase/permease subunit